MSRGCAGRAGRTYEVGLFVDPTRSTRVGASGAVFADTYCDEQVAKNYRLLRSGWLFY